MTDKKKVKVKILPGKFHMHGGRIYEEGAELELSGDQAQWLIGKKVVEGAK